MSVRFASLLLLFLASVTLAGCFPVASVGSGAGVMMAQDRRTREAFLDDHKIEVDGSDLVYGKFKTMIHVNLTSFNRNALISGEVPDEATRNEVGSLISGLPNVHSVYNELTVSPPSSLALRSNDSLITSDVKLRFVNDKRISSEHIKVVTEGGVVYLMGIVTRYEGDAAAEIASTSKGVAQVVKLFEYLD